jgi:lysyl-tRNA synthetase class 2
MCCVQGRLVQRSPATLTLEDESDRRTFGYPNENPELSRVRVGDILALELSWKEGAWRVVSADVLVPCMMENSTHRDWIQRWSLHAGKRRRNLTLRARLINSLRQYFMRHDFLEVETPTLVACPGMEPTLQGFSTIWQGPDKKWLRKAYLPTSPEFHMKKLLVLGYERIFEFCRCFRNGEISELHQPEFTMLEWYRAYSDYTAIMDDMESMVCRAAQELLGKDKLVCKGREIDLSPPWARISVRDLFLEKLRIDLQQIESARQFAIAAQEQGFTYIEMADSFDDIFFKLFLNEIETKLGWGKPVILMDYPMEMAALSRRKPGNPRFCERFEVYIAGIELANAFGELNNAAEQAKRFEEFKLESDSYKGFHYDQDEEFLDALRFGMPPSAGIAVGVDRLAMLFAGETSIDAVTAFPHCAPLVED